MGKRIDVLLLIEHVVFVLEFKVGESEFSGSSIEQVWDYAIDLKNFHETSHHVIVAPILIATRAKEIDYTVQATHHSDKLLLPIAVSSSQISNVIKRVLAFEEGSIIDQDEWIKGRYSPTPTIIEAAIKLYQEHSVKEIIRNEAENLSITTNSISGIIEKSEKEKKKSICFITGVPGAGKTLCGLDIAIKNLDKAEGQRSVYLSGNGPLVAILREALTRDMISREKQKGNKLKK